MIYAHGFVMMTSSNENIFPVTGPLCGEFTGPAEFPTQRPVTWSFDVFFHLRLNKRLSKQPWGWWFETLSWSLWRQCNGCVFCYILCVLLCYMCFVLFLLHVSSSWIIIIFLPVFLRITSMAVSITIVRLSLFQWGNPEGYGNNREKKSNRMKYPYGGPIQLNGNGLILAKFYHWLKQMLSIWQILVQPVVKISSKWWHFCFSGVQQPMGVCGCLINSSSPNAANMGQWTEHSLR